jgi:tetratricopeptide (TPR) repeat protein
MQHFWRRQAVWFLSVLVLFSVFLLSTLEGRLWADRNRWIAQAEERLRQGDREGALKAFQQAAWQRPQDPTLHYNMGVLAESLGRLGESVGHYLSYLRWAPEATDREMVKRKAFQLCGDLAAQAYQNHQYLRALDWYDKARELYPYARAVHFNLSRVYEARGEWDRAAASLKEYYTLCDANQKASVKNWIADCLRKAAEVRFEGGDYDGALARYQEAARWASEDSLFLLNQAMCEEKLGLYEEAKNHYLAYLQVDPMTQQRKAILERIIRLHVLLAEQYLGRGYLSLAQDILNKGLEVDPENPRLHYLFAKTCLGLGQPEQAVAYLEKILELTSEEAKKRPYVEELVRLCTSLADDAYRQKEYSDALRLLKKGMYWAPESSLVAYNLARVYERLEEWEQAILAYRRYLYLNPDAAERNEVKAKLAYYYSFLGAERFKKGEYPQAQEAFEQALLVMPEDKALLYNLATVLSMRGKTAEALHFLERYLKYEKDPMEIERVQRQMTALVSRTEQKSRMRRGKSVSAGLRALEQEEGPEDYALAERKKAYLLLQAGRWQEALDVYQQCLRRVPSMATEEGFQKELASAYREISRAELVAGNMAEALEALEGARKWAPTEAFPYLWTGQVYEHRGETTEALKVYQESLRDVRGETGRQAIRNRIVAILTQRLQHALQKRRLTDALGAMSALEPYLAEEKARDVHYQKARIQGALGSKEKALVDYGLHLFESSQTLQDPRVREELFPLIRDDPDLLASLHDPSEAYGRGKKWSAQGNHAKALFCFLVARSDERSPPDVDAEILRCLEALGMEGEALSILSRRLDGKRPFHLPRTQATRLVHSVEPVLWDDYRAGNYERGLERVRSVQAQLPESELGLNLLQGAFEEMMGRYENAIHRYERALRSGGTLPDERIPPVRERLCTLLIRKALREYEEGQYEACLESLRRAETLVPGRADVAFDLGCAYLRLKNPRGALEAFSRYLKIVQEESPRKQLTSDAILLLQRRLARSPVVRYDGQGIAVDLIFERPVSLGDLLSDGRGMEGEDLLDSVVLAPYLEVSPGGEVFDNL